MRNVLIGSLKDKEQLEANFKYNFYHIPKDKVNLAKNNINYIALYQSKTIFKEDGGILWYGKIKDVELVKRKDEFRLFMELKRRYSKISIEADNGIDDESKIKAFNIDDVKIIVDGESIMSVIGENVIRVSRDEFLKRPMRCIKGLLKRDK
ncbi:MULTISPECIES: hypothetical protein [unclassified Clostridium]|uniref:hypothetical protein n=1 Tax=unclassified Clostridium TaxID=2614128 RepID=UPI0002979169|nr:MULTISPECIES: hypothetical protein [unclassified Clostridium]EKQ57334.1 MAG: hypothetical protein A370_01025 [Clostridium sp. Maddingley MBC34-26]